MIKRSLRPRHLRALLYLAQQPAGKLVSLERLNGIVGQYATNTLKSLAERGFVELTETSCILTDVGKRTIELAVATQREMHL